MKEANLKRLHTVCFQLNDILEKANYGDSKKISGCPGVWWGWGGAGRAVWVEMESGGAIGRAQKNFRAVKILCDTIIMDTCHLFHK